jgi:hypothetical protein
VPSGETESAERGDPEIGETLAVGKLRNWMEDFRLAPGHGIK